MKRIVGMEKNNSWTLLVFGLQNNKLGLENNFKFLFL